MNRLKENYLNEMLHHQMMEKLNITIMKRQKVDKILSNMPVS